MNDSDKNLMWNGVGHLESIRAEIRKRQGKVQSLRRKDGLIKNARNIRASQHGEDGIIQHLFELFGETATTRFCVDVGAWDGQHLSNTYNLLIPPATGWKGILIEADSSRYKQLAELHDPLKNICICQEVSCTNRQQSLSYILSQHLDILPLEFDFLSLDIDGCDYWLLKDVLTTPVKISKSQFRPKVICVEFNPTIPHDVIYINPRNDHIRHGSSLSAFVELCSFHNYVLVETTTYNAFFVTSELYNTYVLQSLPWCLEEQRCPSIEEVHEITMGTQLYQLYDGTIKLSGCQKLLWHRLPINEESIQVLPFHERGTFPFAPPSCNGNEKSNSIHQTQFQANLYKHVIETAVDMAPYLADCSDKKQECSKRLIQQLQNQSGFVIVHGTGISAILCQEALNQTCLFLQDEKDGGGASEQVRRSALSKTDRARRGYSPPNSENFASLLESKGHNDLVRKFRIGPINSSITQSSLHQENIWPDDELWGHERCKEFQSIVEKFYNEAFHVADSIIQAICHGLLNLVAEGTVVGSAADSIRDTVDTIMATDSSSNHTSILTLLGYRKGARHQGKCNRPLVAPHTDVGVLTLLLFDGGDNAVLQRKINADEWVDVLLPPIADDPYFVVNIGDCLSDLCETVLPSALHRVMPRQGGKGDTRNGLALFLGLNSSASITLHGETMTYQDWRKARISRASKSLQSSKQIN